MFSFMNAMHEAHSDSRAKISLGEANGEPERRNQSPLAEIKVSGTVAWCTAVDRMNGSTPDEDRHHLRYSRQYRSDFRASGAL